MLPLKDRTTYRDGWGMKVHIGGPTRDYPEWCYSIAGWWYDRATGRRVSYRRTPDGGGEHYVEAPDRNTLAEEIPNDPWWEGVA